MGGPSLYLHPDWIDRPDADDTRASNIVDERPEPYRHISWSNNIVYWFWSAIWGVGHARFFPNDSDGYYRGGKNRRMLVVPNILPHCIAACDSSGCVVVHFGWCRYME